MTQYFNGQTFDSIEVRLHLERESIVVRVPEGSFINENVPNLKKTPQGFSVPWGSIEGVDQKREELHIKLKSISLKLPKSLLVLNDSLIINEFLELRSRYSVYRNDPASSSIHYKWLLWSVVALFMLSTVFVGFEHIHRVIPTSFDYSLGSKVNKQFRAFFPHCEDAASSEFVNRSMQKLSLENDQFEYQVIVVNDTLQNALALPGGYIFIFKGLLQKSESQAEVLGVIAHEMAHVEKRHSVQQLMRSLGLMVAMRLTLGSMFDGIEVLESGELMAELGSGLLFLNFSREFESEADVEAVRRLHQKQITAQGMKEFFERMSLDSKSESSWWSTHPSHGDRVTYFDQQVQSEQFEGDSLFTRAEWKAIQNSCDDLIDQDKFQWKSIFNVDE